MPRIETFRINKYLWCSVVINDYGKFGPAALGLSSVGSYNRCVSKYDREH